MFSLPLSCFLVAILSAQYENQLKSITPSKDCRHIPVRLDQANALGGLQEGAFLKGGRRHKRYDANGNCASADADFGKRTKRGGKS
jgi:hypothetical protein